jgi:hypothetical protein
VTILVAPKAALALTLPAVGIFWCVNDVLVMDRLTLDEVEPSRTASGTQRATTTAGRNGERFGRCV